MICEIKAKLKSMITFSKCKNAGFSRDGGLDEKVVDAPVNDADLKCISKSGYIYNSDLITFSYLAGLSNAEKDKLVLELQEQNRSVRCENEQFRQKNFSMYLELRKFEKDNKSGTNDE